MNANIKSKILIRRPIIWGWHLGCPIKCRGGTCHPGHPSLSAPVINKSKQCFCDFSPLYFPALKHKVNKQFRCVYSDTHFRFILLVKQQK